MVAAVTKTCPKLTKRKLCRILNPANLKFSLNLTLPLLHSLHPPASDPFKSKSPIHPSIVYSFKPSAIKSYFGTTLMVPSIFFNYSTIRYKIDG
ncbi:uncharacterized protein MELLADRAFT_91166 [Melampsora larici-populina 98AG31]|uniref:Uncharacterized protein n=1 Tax=Melampsora larici-populina (strain 98AG31 / pathotype 3-4-7) TaxID=747676 RepID=F4RY22_MELLP|nr:uncharacterized protein MELLADRAFT_91166 [Melampsora larici-populina 98AG31]EGG02718.1 hypothetical protein MELLADRAFT_91166 [Melampsora larici-populina 98AG31]